MKSNIPPKKGKGITQKRQLFIFLGEKACRNWWYRIQCSNKGQFAHSITSDAIQLKCSLQKSPGIIMYDAETLTINHMLEICLVAITLAEKLLFFYILAFHPSDIEGRLLKG